MSIKITDIKPGDFILARLEVTYVSSDDDTMVVKVVNNSLRIEYFYFPLSAVQSIAPMEIRVGDRVHVIGHALTVVALDGRHAWCRGDDGTFGTYLIADLSFIKDGSPA